MNNTVESTLRFIHLTSSGLLAGSLGFGGSALIPGWEHELPDARSAAALRTQKAFNAIGPTAMVTSIALLVGGRAGGFRRLLDAGAAASLAGVLGTTMLGTIPINQRLHESPALDYPSETTLSDARNWDRAHKLRTALGVTAFVCAVGASILSNRRQLK